MTVLHTRRLRLEPIGAAHQDGLHAMNSRPEVMRYIGSGEPETREQTALMVERVQARWAQFGHSWWAFVALDSGRLAGAGAVQHLRREAEPPADLESLRTNPLEIGWRLHPDFWRLGLASEAAAAMAGFAFGPLAAQELLAVRHPDNQDSARVMQRLGMRERGLQRWYGQLLPTHGLTRDAWLTRETP